MAGERRLLVGATAADNQVVILPTPGTYEPDHSEPVTYADLAATLREHTRPRRPDAEAAEAPRGNDAIGS
jgi:hypothetical protein